MHRDDYFWFQFITDFSGNFGINGNDTRHRSKQNIHLPDLRHFLVAKVMSQVAKMTNTYTIDFKTEDSVSPTVSTFIIVVESGKAIEFDTFNLDRTNAPDYPGIAFDRGCIIMVGMLVTDRNGICRSLTSSYLKSTLGL